MTPISTPTQGNSAVPTFPLTLADGAKFSPEKVQTVFDQVAQDLNRLEAAICRLDSELAACKSKEQGLGLRIDALTKDLKNDLDIHILLIRMDNIEKDLRSIKDLPKKAEDAPAAKNHRVRKVVAIASILAVGFALFQIHPPRYR